MPRSSGHAGVVPDVQIRHFKEVAFLTGHQDDQSNDVLVETLADNGNGSYAYVEDLSSTLQVIALDAKAQVDFYPDGVAY